MRVFAPDVEAFSIKLPGKMFKQKMLRKPKQTID